MQNGNDETVVPRTTCETILLTADELARVLRVPRSWVYSHLNQLPTIRLGRYVRFSRSEIDRFLEQGGSCK